jgi:hypothetical protein
MYDDVSWDNHKSKSRYILQVNKHIVELFAPKPDNSFNSFEVQLPENTTYPALNSGDFNYNFGKTTWTFFKLRNKKILTSGHLTCRMFFSTLRNFNFTGTKESFKEVFIKIYEEDSTTDRDADYPKSFEDFSETVVNNRTWISYQYGDERNYRSFIYYTILGDYTLNFDFNGVGILERGEDYTNFNKPLLDKLINGFLETISIYEVGSPEAELLPEPGIYPSKEEMTKDISYTGL